MEGDVELEMEAGWRFNWRGRCERKGTLSRERSRERTARGREQEKARDRARRREVAEGGDFRLD